MIKSILLALAIITITALPKDDLVNAPPGMLQTVIYSGYLNTSVQGRQIHYVFVQANLQDPSNASLAVWLNGGPGCSSLMGMLSEIGPYMVGNDYKLGDMLKKNDYSWSNAANLLFLESPAIVGFSTQKDSKYQWTDEETARDAFAAIKDFIFNKAPEFSERPLFITGQSYAGKYIPDITDLILNNNIDSTAKYINLKGIMVGNGVMNFEDNSLDKSQTQYMFTHDLVSSRLEVIYARSCGEDYNSPRCKFVNYELDILEAYLNPYNIYEICQRSNSQANRLRQMLWRRKSKRDNGQIYRTNEHPLGEIPDCPQDRGGIQYWNLNKIPYHVAQVNKTWSVCTHLNYSISQRGSMKEYSRILLNGGLRVWLYSGDWDDVVPFTDTQKNVEKLNRAKVGEWSSWNVLDQHGGFYQVYDKNLTVITVKGAGHMVPETQPKASYQLFYNFINNKGVNNQIY